MWDHVRFVLILILYYVFFKIFYYAYLEIFKFKNCFEKCTKSKREVKKKEQWE